MGIIKRQAIKQTIVNYVGVLLGTLNVLYIYPKYLTTEEFGLLRIILDVTALIVPFAFFGANNVAVKFFGLFNKSKRSRSEFLTVLLLYSFIGFLLFSFLLLIFKNQLIDFYQNKSALVEKSMIYIVIAALGLLMLSIILDRFILNYKRIVVSSIFNNLGVKFGILILIVLKGYLIISFNTLTYLLPVVFFITSIGLGVYLYSLSGLSLKRPSRDIIQSIKKADVKSFALFSMLGSFGTIIATRIDTLMIANLTTFDNVAIYTIPLFMSSVIVLPLNAITNISSPIITTAWLEEDYRTLSAIYKKSSITLLVFGLAIFLLIWTSIDNLFLLIPNNDAFIKGKNVVLILGIAKIIDLATSVNNQIIVYSKYYKFNFYAILILAVLNIICNYVFIPKLDIIGAALATLVSIGLFNLSKLIFIYLKFKMSPFSLKTIVLFVLAIAVYFIVSFIPNLAILENSAFNAIFNIAMVSTIFILIYGISIYRFKISGDINTMVDNILNKFLNPKL